MDRDISQAANVFSTELGQFDPNKQFGCRLAAPEILEPRRRQLGVADRVLNVLMTEVSLKRSGIVSLVGERVAAGVPEHVRVRLEAKLGPGARALNHAGETSRREWSTAFRGEHERRFGLLFALKPPQGAQLVPEDRMRTRGALLDPADVQGAVSNST